MRYVLINPYPIARPNGITTYTRNLLHMLEERGVEATCISNDGQVPRAEFQQIVRDAVTTRFRPDEVLIEAPELSSSTLLLPPAYRVHVRLHCPSALVQRHNAVPVDLEQFQKELHVVRTAHIASSPSFALLRELEPYLDVARIHVYKNPPPDPALMAPEPKQHDVLYMGNFGRLKGTDFLNPLLTRFPPHYSVVLVGRFSEGFEVSPDVRCRVRVGALISGVERLALLARSRVALSPSRFENCSMMVLESLAAGTVVAGWRVGGHHEIADSRLIRLAPFGDVDALASIIATAVDGAYPGPAEFRSATEALDADFRHGWSQMWAIATGASQAKTYRGLGRAARSA
jgi:glycosyltransferase involved in cell wall biosynthesis